MKRLKFGVPVFVGVAALLVGGGIMSGLIAMRKPPAEASPEDRKKAIRVNVIAVQPRNVPTTISGFGQVKAMNVVKIGPEVSGRVSEIHPNLLVGGIVPKGEAMFVIDPEPYRAKVEDAKARVAQLEGSLARLNAEQKNEETRMEAMERSRDLAKAQFERLKELLSSDNVGTQTNVDEAERTYVNAKDQTDQVSNDLALFPLRIREATGMLESARAQLALAELDLQKTRVDAPFNARVTNVTLKKDQVIAPGEPVVTVSDDSILELSVPLNSMDARQWLRFGENRSLPDAAWFSDVEKVSCMIRWSDDPEGHCWTGTLDRVESFDQSSRTLTVAVRVMGPAALSGDEKLPLVEGMFCKVEIPGRAIENVYEIPQHAINSFDGTVCVAEDNRLKTVSVRVARRDENTAYVSEGLKPGQLVITTRLINPLENSLLEVVSADENSTL